MLSDLSDQILLGQIMQNNGDALAELYDRHAQTVFNLIVCIVRDEAVADELLQETFWQVWQKADQFRGEGEVAAWLFRVARNKSLDELRRRTSRPLAESDSLAEELSLATAHDVEKSAEQSWQAQRVHQALSQIPDEQRHCLDLAYFRGLSHRQIAEQMDLPMGTVKTRIRLAMQKLEQFLQAAGFRTEHEAEA